MSANSAYCRKLLALPVTDEAILIWGGAVDNALDHSSQDRTKPAESAKIKASSHDIVDVHTTKHKKS